MTAVSKPRHAKKTSADFPIIAEYRSAETKADVYARAGRGELARKWRKRAEDLASVMTAECQRVMAKSK